MADANPQRSHDPTKGGPALVINIQDDILKLHALGLLDRLLQDKATKGNILWATDAYAELGEWYSPGNEIRPQRITGEWSDLIKTRARRAMEQRTERTRQHAEVFTPLWIVKKMNDFADEQWFKRKSGIYKLTDEGKIYFSKDKHWKLYVDARRMEITCGEAPFLVTRYDVETGEVIPIEDRIGLLDRKLRAVTENTQDIEEWKTWALRAVQSVYGYELQGDNLLIARVNILCSVEEHMFHRWRQRPDKAWLEKLCNVISWNLWQMDGIHGCVPVPPRPTEEQLSLFPPLHEQTNLFGEMEEQEIPCRLYDWRGDQSLSYTTLREKGTKAMKFDFIIGNPPYNQEAQQTSTSDDPIYNYFMDEAYCIGDRVELITPARFLMNAGKTPVAWNRKMLSDVHLKVLFYEGNSQKVFPNTLIPGGIAITYRDAQKEFGAIEHFVYFPELMSIKQKVSSFMEESINSIMYNQNKFNLPAVYADFPEIREKIGSDGKDKRFRQIVLERFPQLFHEQVVPNAIRVLGLIGRQRAYRFIYRKYVEGEKWIDKYKVFVPFSNGASGTLGHEAARLISKPVIGDPGDGITQTFIGVGCFDSLSCAENCKKYILSKFARALLGILKVTQGNKPETWTYVPIQDFTPDSDIDWSKSIPEIDQQLYRKYGLDEKEIAFIESHVKEMS